MPSLEMEGQAQEARKPTTEALVRENMDMYV